MQLLKAICLMGLFGLSTAPYADSKTTVPPIAVTADGLKIIAYYSQHINGHSKRLTRPEQNGYYRVLLGQDQKGYLVQDFYQDTGTKQTNPFYIQNKQDIKSSAPQSHIGELYVYDLSGKKNSKVIFDDQYLIQHVSHYLENGQMLSRSDYDNHTLSFNNKYWYKNGKLALDITYNLNLEIVQAQAWHKNGQAINPSQCFIDKKYDIENVRSDKCTVLIQQFNNLTRQAAHRNTVKK